MSIKGLLDEEGYADDGDDDGVNDSIAVDAEAEGEEADNDWKMRDELK
jgi:hypothetical protein